MHENYLSRIVNRQLLPFLKVSGLFYGTTYIEIKSIISASHIKLSLIKLLHLRSICYHLRFWKKVKQFIGVALHKTTSALKFNNAFFA